MKRLVVVLGVTLLGCVTVSVPPECRARRPFISAGVPLSVHMEIERVAVKAENECMAKRGQNSK